MNCGDIYPISKRFWNTFKLACSLGIVLVNGGCISIPAGSDDMVSHEWGEFETVKTRPAENIYLSGDIVQDELVVRLLSISAVHEELESEKIVVTSNKSLIAGLFPGLFANWHGGYTLDGEVSSSAGSYAIDLVAFGISAPITNAILGVPTFLPWFTEAGSGWRPPATRENEDKLVQTSLIGYAKTSRESRAPGETKPAPGRTHLKVDPVANSVLILSLQEVDLKWEETTNAEGTVSIPLSRLIAQGATGVHVQTSDARLTKEIALPSK